MNKYIPFTSSKMSVIAVGLMAMQFIVKLAIEINKAMETTHIWVVAAAIVFAMGWLAIIPICIAGQRSGYWFGAVWGLLHFVMVVPLPIAGVCDHYYFAALVATHGILITGSCLAVLLSHDNKNNVVSHYFSAKKIDTLGYVLLCACILARTLMITFVEPNCINRVLAAAAGKGKSLELVAASSIFVVVSSMLALCVIIPGIIMKRRWAFTSAAIFGGIHVILTAIIVIFHVNSGYGPIVVIPASLGMLMCGIWMLNIHAYQTKYQRVQPIDGHDLISQ